MRARHGLLDAAAGRSRIARQLPIARQFEPGILDLANHARAFDSESRGAEGLLQHSFEGDSVEPPLIKIVHVFAIAFAVSDDVESQVCLIARRPLDELVDFRAAERGFLHGVFYAGIARVAAYNGAEERWHLWLASVLESRQARGEASLVNVRPYSFFQRTRRKINLANQTGTVLMVNQRRPGAASKVDLRVGKPFSYDRRDLRGGYAVTTVIVDE